MKYKNYEIIFIDNNSTDNSIDFVEKNYNNVRIIKNPRDYGFAKANNIAASKARGKYLAFLNIDTVVDENWLSELVKIAESSDDIGIVVSKHYYYHDKSLINYAGGNCDKYLKTGHVGLNKRDNKILNSQRDTSYACFAAALMKRKLYEKIGLFDPYYYAFCEDLDLSLRTWIAGYRVVYAPKSFIYHKTGQILGKKSPRKKYFLERNRLRTLLKNYELKSLFIIFPRYIVKRIGIIFRFLLKLNSDAFFHGYIYLKSICWNVIYIRSLLKYRKIIQYYRKNSDKILFQILKKNDLFYRTIKAMD